MIPKIVHYCWLGDDAYPDLVKNCIQSWKQKLPDWELKLWDKKCLKELDSSWVLEAYEAKKYAFAADYIRLYAVYTYGGFYLDSDVEVLKDFAPLLKYPYVFCAENSEGDIEAATFGAEPHNQFVLRCLSYYEGKHFVLPDGSLNIYPLPKIMKDQLRGMVQNINSLDDYDVTSLRLQLLPIEYFSPKDSGSGKLLYLTERTYSIHHFTASWFSLPKKVFKVVSRIFGIRVAKALSVIYKLFFKKC